METEPETPKCVFCGARGMLCCGCAVVHQVGSKTTLRLSEVEYVGFAERNETVVYHLWLRAQKDELHHLLRFKHVFPDSPLARARTWASARQSPEHPRDHSLHRPPGDQLCAAGRYWKCHYGVTVR